MKKCFLLGLFTALMSFANVLLAQCQLCYLNEDNVKRAINFLNFEKEVVIYYSDCANKSVKDLARRVKIEKVSYQKAEREGYFEIVLEGTTIGTFEIEEQLPVNYSKTDMKFSEVIDITYVHIRSGGYVDASSGRKIWDTTSLGIFLGFDCDPCTDTFDYPF